MATKPDLVLQSDRFVVIFKAVAILLGVLQAHGLGVCWVPSDHHTGFADIGGMEVVTVWIFYI